MFEPKRLQIQGCQKVTATSDIAGYFAVITGYKLAGISDKSGNTIKEKSRSNIVLFQSCIGCILQCAIYHMIYAN